jgi:hypothetical protein
MSEPNQDVQEIQGAQPRQMLVSLAPEVDAVELREHDGAWLLCFDDELMVLIEEDAYRQCLVLTAELGVPRAGSEAEIYKQLLQVAARWQDMQGIRMGLDPEDDCVLQIADVGTANLPLNGLAERVLSFVSTARHCRQVLASVEENAPLRQNFVRA